MGIARHKIEDYYRTQIRQMQKTRRILAGLPEPYGLILLWRYWEKRSAREMADNTGKTEKAIERLLI